MYLYEEGFEEVVGRFPRQVEDGHAKQLEYLEPLIEERGELERPWRQQ